MTGTVIWSAEYSGDLRFISAVGASQPVEARLEFVGVVDEKPEVGHSEVGPSGGRHVTEGEGRQRGVAAGAAPGDDQPVAVDLTLGGQVAGGGQTVLDVDDAPVHEGGSGTYARNRSSRDS